MDLPVPLAHQPLASLVDVRTEAALLSGLRVHSGGGLLEALFLAPVEQIINSSLSDLARSSLVDCRTERALLELVDKSIWIRVSHILHHLVVRFSLSFPKMHRDSLISKLVVSDRRPVLHLSHLVLNLLLSETVEPFVCLHLAAEKTVNSV